MGASYLSKALEVNQTITYCDVSNNMLGDGGAFYLGKGLAKNSVLTTFIINSNQFKKKGATSLAESVGYNTSLTQLTLVRCGSAVAAARTYAPRVL